MAEREPTVIERMAEQFIARWAPEGTWSRMDADHRGFACVSMLAAVRWLKDHADKLSTNEETRAAVWGVLNFAIAKHEHERRAGGKDQ